MDEIRTLRDFSLARSEGRHGLERIHDSARVNGADYRPTRQPRAENVDRLEAEHARAECRDEIRAICRAIFLNVRRHPYAEGAVLQKRERIFGR
jgi:hypothetical protein